MFTVKLKTVHKTMEVFVTDKYLISSKKDMHPDILSVDVYSEGKKICHISRHFKWFYKKYIYDNKYKIAFRTEKDRIEFINHLERAEEDIKEGRVFTQKEMDNYYKEQFGITV